MDRCRIVTQGDEFALRLFGKNACMNGQADTNREACRALIYCLRFAIHFVLTAFGTILIGWHVCDYQFTGIPSPCRLAFPARCRVQTILLSCLFWS